MHVGSYELACESVRKPLAPEDSLLAFCDNCDGTTGREHLNSCHLIHNMSEIKCVGVVGTGVIGASWTALFLSQGLQVLVSDPAPDAHKKLAAHLDTFWPVLKEIGLAPGASLDNYRFVGASLGKYFAHVDYIQEVGKLFDLVLGSKLIGMSRTHPRTRSSRQRS